MRQLRILQVLWPSTVLVLSFLARRITTEKAGLAIVSVICGVHLLAGVATFGDWRVGWVTCVALSMSAFGFFGLATVLTAGSYVAGSLTFRESDPFWIVLAILLGLMVIPAALSLSLMWSNRHELKRVFKLATAGAS